MERPTTPGSGFSFRKKSYATPTRTKNVGGKKGSAAARSLGLGDGLDKENGLDGHLSADERERSGNGMTNTEFLRRSRRVLTQTVSTGDIASAASEAAAGAIIAATSEAEEDLVELQFHKKKSKKSPRLLKRSTGSDGCEHGRTPTRGEVERAARAANAALTDEEVEAVVAAKEAEYTARHKREEAAAEARRIAEEAEEAAQAEAAAFIASSAVPFDDDMAAGAGFDDDAVAAAAAEEVPKPTEPEPAQDAPPSKKRKSPESSDKRMSSVQATPRPRDGREQRRKRKPRKLQRTVTADEKLSGEQMMELLQPVLDAELAQMESKDRSQHPAVVDRMTDICTDFAANVKGERYFRRSNIQPNARNDMLRTRERSLRVLLGRLDAEATQWRAIKKEFEAAKTQEEGQTEEEQAPEGETRDEAQPAQQVAPFDANPLLQECLLHVDEVLPVLQSIHHTEREASEYMATVSQAVAHESFAAFGRDEDARDLIQQIAMP